MKQNGTPLTDLKEGQDAIVVDVDTSPGRCRRRGKAFRGRANGEQGCAQRLTDLGLTPGAKLTVVKSAPFGGPLEVMVRGMLVVAGGVLNQLRILKGEPESLRRINVFQRKDY
jgi:Fe2+ transport system protein FeoA